MNRKNGIRLLPAQRLLNKLETDRKHGKSVNFSHTAGMIGLIKDLLLFVPLMIQRLKSRIPTSIP
jgi:hypothetical protein